MVSATEKPIMPAPPCVSPDIWQCTCPRHRHACLLALMTLCDMQRYGSSCYRRNPDHLRDFSHPTCTPPVDTAVTPVTPAVDAVGACATTATKPDPQPCAQQMPSDESLKGVEETPAGDDGAPPGKRPKPAPAVTPPAPAPSPSPSPSPFDWKEACRAALKMVRPFKMAVAEAATDRLDRLENMSGLPIFSRPVRLSVMGHSRRAPPGTRSNFQSSTMTYGRQPDSPLPLPHARARARGGRVDRSVTIHAVGQLAAANLLILEYSQSGRRLGPHQPAQLFGYRCAAAARLAARAHRPAARVCRPRSRACRPV